MPKTDSIIKLITYLDEFEKINSDYEIEDFSIFLTEKLKNKKEFSSKSKPDFSKEENYDYKKFIEVEFSTLLTNLYRFAKHYLKKAFKNTSFNSVDEFSFLATLIKEKQMSKSELINRHLLEISTGSEVLRRLVKNGLIKEIPDPKDGRAKIVSLTEKGFSEITTSFGEMFLVAKIVKGNLTIEEITITIDLFKKLSLFHWNIHESNKDSELNEILNKFVKE